VLRLVSGTVFSQPLLLLATPVLSRCYAPEAFGLTALFLSLTDILGELSCMRYEFSIVLPKSDREAANLLGVSLGLRCSYPC
jgi:O-antigen/teichoic acid export membrane protein